ncbi:hypothetical protein NECAME_04100 [Necator americanus]|uniref:Uncharacterized protein n=1 Tax=Necator americanus TaxID=51031 RepID=W2SX67_NECAM|nr:hypothetical protein NECAME_04100 [Necator americanus]ETN74235.1 hypothetical protein NECAME_04100 [Necator americanus]
MGSQRKKRSPPRNDALLEQAGVYVLKLLKTNREQKSSSEFCRCNVLGVTYMRTRVFSQTLSPPITSKFKCLTNGCCDEHEWCRFWASIGECQLVGSPEACEISHDEGALCKG